MIIFFGNETVIIRAGERLGEWQNALADEYHPRRMVFAIPDTANNLPSHLQQRTPHQDGVAYVCREISCLPPILSLQELGQLYST